MKVSAQGYNDTIITLNIEDNSTLLQDIYLQPTSTSLLSCKDSIEDVIIFPNPCKEKLFLRNNNFFAYNIFSFQRKILIKHEEKNINSIDVSELPSGVYFLELYSDKKTQTLIFIKQ
jgi:hypothetical protein